MRRKIYDIPLIVPERVIRRFYSKIDIKSDNECWNWKGSLGHRNGNAGSFIWNNVDYSHRDFLYLLNMGEIPQSRYVSYSCGNPACCNPRHLLLVSTQELFGDGRTIKIRFMENVNKIRGGCWEWTGSRFSGGYGSFWDGEKNRKAHRVSYQLFVGQVPDNLLVCHTCDNPPCVNPKHLFLGTNQDNQVDALKKGRLNPMYGEKQVNHKLTEKDVIYIHKHHKMGETQVSLANKFGVSFQQINRIVHNQRWSHIK